MKIHSLDAFKYGLRRRSFCSSCSGAILALGLLAFCAMQARATTFVLGTTNLLVGSGAQTNSVVLGVTPADAAWTATTNAAWLHLTTPNQSGTGSTNVIFSCDANSGTTRSGTLTIGDKMLTVTQAGSGFIQAQPLSTIFINPIILQNIAVDGEGDVYVAAPGGNVGPQNIFEWTPTNNAVNYLGIPGLSHPAGVAVDTAGNLYIADTGNSAVEEWVIASGKLISLVSSNLSSPSGVAVDGLGDVFIADTGNNVVKEWVAATSNVTILATGLRSPEGVAVDVAGNVYISDSGNGVVKEWIAASSNVVAVAEATGGPLGVAVDGSGNVYAGVPGNGVDVADYLLKWTAASGSAAQLFVPTFTHQVGGVAVNREGDVFFSDVPNGYVDVLPNDFVDVTPRTENSQAGSDSWQAVLPATANVSASSDQSWLTIDGVTNGVLSISFAANISGASRTGNVSLLGQVIPVTQYALPTVQMVGPGTIQIAFSNIQQATFTVSSAADLSLPVSKWAVVAVSSNVAPGMFRFISQPTANDPQRFYRVTSP